ncbi:MAG: hypothetical protein JSS95_08100 [Acidobacteria bacterium]|nr:hypothetical protein [Acidobacteriota bacterium]
MRLLATLLFGALSASSLAQVSGRFYIYKSAIPVGQTAVVRFKVTNSTSQPYRLDTTGFPGQPLCAGYTVKVIHQPKTLKIDRNRGNTCILNGQFQHVMISPGATFIQDIDLSIYLDLSAKGRYAVEVTHHSFRKNDAPHDPLDCSATVEFRVR